MTRCAEEPQSKKRMHSKTLLLCCTRQYGCRNRYESMCVRARHSGQNEDKRCIKSPHICISRQMAENFNMKVCAKLHTYQQESRRALRKIWHCASQGNMAKISKLTVFAPPHARSWPPNQHATAQRSMWNETLETESNYAGHRRAMLYVSSTSEGRSSSISPPICKPSLLMSAPAFTLQHCQ